MANPRKSVSHRAPSPTTGCTPQVSWGLGSLALVCLLGACQADLAPPAGSGSRALQRPPASPAGPLRWSLGSGADLRLADAAMVLRSTWGDGPGQYGRQEQGARPGPASLAVTADDTLLVLDRVNRRVQRLTRGGRPLAPLPTASQTVEDIAAAGQRIWGLTYVPGRAGYRVERYGEGGPDLRLPLRSDLELATGLFVTGAPAAPELWVEQNHDTQLKVVAGGRALAAHEQTARVLGRPHRGLPGWRLSALRRDARHAVVLGVQPGHGARPLLEVQTPRDLVAIQELESDADGRVYLGLLLGELSGPDDGPMNLRKVVVVWKRGWRRCLTVELAAKQATDVFRPVAVSPGGALYQLQTTEHQVLVRRWDLSAREVTP